MGAAVQPSSHVQQQTYFMTGTSIAPLPILAHTFATGIIILRYFEEHIRYLENVQRETANHT
jgi:hypothetical protein